MNYLTEAKILTISKNLGKNWEICAIVIEYQPSQIDMYKSKYLKQIDTLLFVMIKKWCDTLVCERDINIKRFLAKGFCASSNNREAANLIDDKKELLFTIKNIEIPADIKEKMKKLRFNFFNHRLLKEIYR